MAASTALLLQIVEEPPGAERDAAIREQFLVFESRNDRGAAFFTGYFEPILPGSLARSDSSRAPLYGVPADLVTLDLAPFADAGLVPAELRARACAAGSRGGSSSRTRTATGSASAARSTAAPSRSRGWPTRSSCSSCRSRGPA